MLSTNIVLATALAYVALLFLLAYFSDRFARKNERGLLRSPLIYTLSISVYCTSWTFYGAVGSAARSGFEFAAIYLGPTLVFAGGWLLLRKLIRIGHVHRITSIADLVSSRYGKSSTLAVLVTLIAVISTTPYIALQLKAVTTSFDVVSRTQSASNIAQDSSTGFWVAFAMAVFTIAFGTRNVDANEHHPGVVAAIAFEALVKLLALLAVGLFVVFGIGGGITNVFAMSPAEELLDHTNDFGVRWVSLVFLSAIAIICLPRQFQVTVVENANEGHIRTASWLFPLYLLLISLFVLPIAIVGLAVLPPGSNPDMFVLTLPMSTGQETLALFAFIGGFSSATSMVIVASIALSIMVSNHIVVPIALRLPWLSLDASGDIKNLLLRSRRISIAAILMLGFLYFKLSAQSDALASIGLIAFTGVAQLLPSLLGGLYWRHATATGAIVGLITGSLIWAWTLLLPSFETSHGWLQGVLQNGPFGLEVLRPEQLFGLAIADPLVHALFWSLGLNTVLFIMVSLLSNATPLERVQSTLFVDVFRNIAGNESRAIRRSAGVDDLYILTQRLLGPNEAFHLFEQAARRQGLGDDMPRPDAEFIARLERRFAGTIGAASAHILISQVATGETISVDEVITLVDERQQVIEYSRQLEQKSKQLESTAAELVSANERLRELDAQKDEFLSQVSHELRTPMTSIRSFSEILLDTDDVKNDQSRRFLNVIHTESQRLSRLLDEILEPSQLERTSLALEVRDIDPDQSLRHAVRTSEGHAAKRGVSLSLQTHAAVVTVRADSDRLCQVFINLIANAVNHNDNASPKIIVDSRLRDGLYQVRVADNGSGIAPNDRERIFERFSLRSTNGGSQHSTGAGLGLYISRRIMRELKGDLILTDGSGGMRTCFLVTLPARQTI